MIRVRAVALAAVLLVIGLVTAPAAAADQCSPPGVQSASSLPTNLAKAAKGPDEDRYTTANVEPLSAVNVGELGLGTPDKLLVGT
jgi:polar amino acid transport system substrate-binding protein